MLHTIYVLNAKRPVASCCRQGKPHVQRICDVLQTITLRGFATAVGDDAVASGIDLDRYPVHDLKSARLQDVLSHARRQLESTGCASFPGFLRPDATKEAAAAAALGAATNAFVTDAEHNAYQLPEDDPCDSKPKP